MESTGLLYEIILELSSNTIEEWMIHLTNGMQKAQSWICDNTVVFKRNLQSDRTPGEVTLQIEEIWRLTDDNERDRVNFTQSLLIDGMCTEYDLISKNTTRCGEITWRDNCETGLESE
jgi:hypothetical protein